LPKPEGPGLGVPEPATAPQRLPPARRSTLSARSERTN
jgi:hypothetical protein